MAEDDAGPIHRKHDWAALEAEWLASGESLHAFGRRHKIPRTHMNNMAGRYGWLQKRQKIRVKAGARIEKLVENRIVLDYSRQAKLWEAVEKKAEKFLERTAENGGELSPMDLNTLTQAIERALKSKRLMGDKSTENTAVSGQVNHNHLVANLMQGFHSGDPNFIDVQSIEEDDDVRPDATG